MSELFYDLHIHSCLSPCGDEEMTPHNIVNMALLTGRGLIALTDHNSCGNVRAVATLAKAAGIAFLPGMELTTAEEIHLLCLFPDCEKAEGFAGEVYDRLPPIANRPDIFGHQYRRGVQDELLEEEPRLLITATDIPLGQAPILAARYGGVCIPAHIEKEANSLLGILGAWPQDCDFPYFEVAKLPVFTASPHAAAISKGRILLQNSDAHYLWEISERQEPFPPGDTPLHHLVKGAFAQLEK